MKKIKTLCGYGLLASPFIWIAIIFRAQIISDLADGCWKPLLALALIGGGFLLLACGEEDSPPKDNNIK